MPTTARSKNGTSSGDSTQQTPDAISPFVQSRIALALLKQSVLDLAGRELTLRAQSARWLNSDGCKEVCSTLSIPYTEFWEAIRDMTFRPYAQRIFLARKLIKTFPTV